MSQMDTMTINGQKTISREELLALKGTYYQLYTGALELD